MTTHLTAHQQAMIAQLEQHIAAEQRGDVDATMQTMTDTPHLNHIPTMMGAKGPEAVRAFYQNLLPAHAFFPSDTQMTPVSRTVGTDQIVDEIILSFTHTSVVGWMLPDMAPTGKAIKIPLVVIFKFIGEKIADEDIYWDQASILVQLGLLDPGNLPMHGAQCAQKMQALLQP